MGRCPRGGSPNPWETRRLRDLAHGIEPKLSLRYSSQNGNGLLGIGWSLSGISQIVRVGPRHSAPTYNPTKDTFVLDGIDLVPCAQAAVSPSCRSGGNYATMMESYARIDRTSVNRFVVTTRDGTRAIYGPVNTTDRGVLRWGVTQVIDTHGNVVDYNWALSTGRDAYPTSIRYNGNIINFFREHRPDQETFATGSGLGQAAHRLKTIDVRVGLAHCARLRAPLRVHRAPSPVQAGVRAHVRHGRDPGP